MKHLQANESLFAKAADCPEGIDQVSKSKQVKIGSPVMQLLSDDCKSYWSTEQSCMSGNQSISSSSDFGTLNLSNSENAIGSRVRAYSQENLE